MRLFFGVSTTRKEREKKRRKESEKRKEGERELLNGLEMDRVTSRGRERELLNG